MNMMGADFAENVEYVDSPEPAMIEPKAITPPLSETSTEAEFRAHQGPQAPIRLAPQPKVGAVARQVPQAQQPPRGTKPDSQANFMAPAAPGSFLKPRRQHPVAAAMSPSQHPVSPKDDQAAGFKSPAVPAPVVPQRQQSQPVAPRVVQPKQHANLMANATQPTQALVRTPPVKRAREESMDFDASEFGTPATKDSPRNDNSAPIVPKSVKRQKPAARSPVVDFETEVVAQLSQPLDFSAIIQLEEEVRQMTVENAEQCDENDKQMQGLKQDAREGWSFRCFDAYSG